MSSTMVYRTSEPSGDVTPWGVPIHRYDISSVRYHWQPPEKREAKRGKPVAYTTKARQYARDMADAQRSRKLWTPERFAATPLTHGSLTRIGDDVVRRHDNTFIRVACSCGAERCAKQTMVIAKVWEGAERGRPKACAMGRNRVRDREQQLDVELAESEKAA